MTTRVRVRRSAGAVFARARVCASGKGPAISKRRRHVTAEFKNPLVMVSAFPTQGTTVCSRSTPESPRSATKHAGRQRHYFPEKVVDRTRVGATGGTLVVGAQTRAPNARRAT